MSFEHNTFISPFTWRYGSQEMRHIWSEVHKRRLMRQVWVALAAAQHEAGLVSAEQLAALESKVDEVVIDRALELERETRHDVMAEIRAFAEQCPAGAKIIHLGATSADITDNVDVLRLRQAGRLLAHQLETLLGHFANQIEAHATLPIMAYTHIQPAEPTTLGYRLAGYAQDLLENWQQLQTLLANLRGKGLKGAVGTQASFQQLLAGTPISAQELEATVMARLALPYFSIASQTYPRQQDLHIQQWLAALAASLHKFALDFRLLQSPTIGEWREPFGRQQVGSSAMPFKRNPIQCENICSLARYVASLANVAWENASQAILERSLDDSANRRIFQAESFLATEEMLLKANQVVAGMVIDRPAVERNLATFGPFAATERVLMALVRAGADRQEGHEWIRQVSLQAWEQMGREGQNPLLDLLLSRPEIGQFLSESQIREAMNVEHHLGTAGERAWQFAQTVRQTLP